MTGVPAAMVLLTTGLPALTAAVGGPLRPARAAARSVALLGALATLAVAVVSLVVQATAGSAPGATLIEALPALETGGLEVPLLLQGGGPVALVAAVVATVTLAVQGFAAWYLRDDDRYPVFAATVSLFAAGMLLVVHSADLVLTLVGWEVMGWCSYLLIGHWSRREPARRAALKAFLVTRLADVGFVLGVVVLAAGASSTSYPAVVAHWVGPAADGTLRSVALVLLVVGVLGKSAQFPFQDWLPDAMEGPTPASALIHAATMVAAGTFVLAQLAPVLTRSDPARWVLAVSVTVSMVGAALLALGQSDLKRLLAWSTVSQIAIMLSPLAAAPAAEASSAASLHLVGHAFFKALLFLTVGWLGVLGGGTSVAALRGTGRRRPSAGVAWAVGLLALAGVPLTVGGVSKEHVVATVEAAAAGGGMRSLVVEVALLATVVLTAAYATRAHLVVSRGQRVVRAAGAVTVREPAPAPEKVGPGEGASAPAGGSAGGSPTPVVVRVVLGGLVVLTVLGGLVTATGLLPGLGEVSAQTLLLSLVLILLGVVLPLWSAGTLSAGASAAGVLPASAARWAALADAGLGADRAYRALVVRPVIALARFATFLDRDVLDAYVRGAAGAARLAGAAGRRAHARERASTGLFWVALGALALAGAGVVVWS